MSLAKSISAFFISLPLIVSIAHADKLTPEERYLDGTIPIAGGGSLFGSFVYEGLNGDLLIPFYKNISHNFDISVWNIKNKSIVHDDIENRKDLKKIYPARLISENSLNIGSVLGIKKLKLDNNRFIVRIESRAESNCLSALPNYYYKIEDREGKVISEKYIFLYSKEGFSFTGCDQNGDEKNYFVYYHLSFNNIYILSSSILFIDNNTGDYVITDFNLSPSHYNGSILLVESDILDNIIKSGDSFLKIDSDVRLALNKARGR